MLIKMQHSKVHHINEKHCFRQSNVFIIKPVFLLLVGKKGVGNFWPLSIAGKTDEEILIVVLLCNRNCILKGLLYIS